MSKIDDIANKTFTIDKNGNITNIGVDVTKKNKELSPLEALEKLTNYKCSCMSEKMMCKEIIENALKRLEKIENSNVSVLREDISKQLKAFEIIKEKFVNITILMGCDNLEEYNKHPLTMRKGRLTQEEFNLLKEVLL